MKFQIKFILVLIGLALLALAVRAAAGKTAAGDEAAFRRFLKTYEARVMPLSRDAALASFQASISGKDEDYQRSSALQIQLNKASADPRGVRQPEAIPEKRAGTRAAAEAPAGHHLRQLPGEPDPGRANGGDGQAAGADRAEVQHLPHPHG